LNGKVLTGLNGTSSKPSALDVGCGPGLVMDLVSPMTEVQGLDVDPEMVAMARKRGYVVTEGDAVALPFKDGSFDLVFCSFTLLWVSDPQKVIREMARVARKYVVCLAEPDYGGRICVPNEVADLDKFLVQSLVAEGADPFIGRKLGMLMERAGLEVESGVLSGAWSPKQLREEKEQEWDSIANAVGTRVDEATLNRAKTAWLEASLDRSLFLFNPVFYAIGSK
jgi:SAM-dependent methyltransferase